MFAEFLANRESVLPWIKEYSPYEWVSKDDPPVYLNYSVAPALGQEQKDPAHTSNFGAHHRSILSYGVLEGSLKGPQRPGI